MIPLKPLIISAPFGNYIQPKYATATLGTFTLAARPPGTEDNPAKGGRLKQILKTVRYNPFKRAWRNKIGLRNPGIEWLENRENVEGQENKLSNGVVSYTKDKIISVHGFSLFEWTALLTRASFLCPLAIEVNVSCPNVAIHNPFEVFDCLEYVGNIPIIVKLPPIGFEKIVEKAWHVGIRCFHACNTIPSPKGGISGKPLKPLSLQAVAWLRDYTDGTAQIIGGGGITCMKDVREYQEAGADHVSVASCLFFPWNIWKFSRIAKLLDAEAENMADWEEEQAENNEYKELPDIQDIGTF